MESSFLIMHKNAMDVAIEVYSCYADSKGDNFITGRYLNLGYTGTPWYVTGIEKIKIANRADWVVITWPMIEVPRQAPGLPA